MTTRPEIPTQDGWAVEMHGECVLFCNNSEKAAGISPGAKVRVFSEAKLRAYANACVIEEIARLREVLDGPDVAAALVERQAVRPMSTAPRDGTVVMLHFDKEYKVRAYCRCTFAGGPKHWGTGPHAEHNLENRCQPIGWSPVK